MKGAHESYSSAESSSSDERGAVIFVVEDNDVTRQMLRRTLESAGYQVEAFASAEEFLAKVDRSRGDCVVTDVHMQGMNGVDLQVRLEELGFTLPVIVITGYPSTSLAIQAMQRGAATFIPKPYRAEDLLYAVGAALRTSRQDRQRGERRRALEALFASLQPGELAVLELLAIGQQNKSIAQRLDVSLRTVEGRRARILEALGVASAADAVRLSHELKSLR